MSLTKFLQTLVDGIAVGSLYALIALGYTMVYGILQFINFAHSDVFMLGAWFVTSCRARVGWTEVDAAVLVAARLVLLAAMVVCGARSASPSSGWPTGRCARRRA